MALKLPSFTVPELPKGAKVLVPLIGLALIGVIAVLARQNRDLSGQLATRVGEIRELTAQSQALSTQVKSLKETSRSLDSQLGNVREELSSASTVLDDVRMELETLATRHEHMQEENTRLKEQLSRTSKERDEGRERLAKLEAENAELDRALMRLRERMNLLSRDYDRVRAKLSQFEASPPSSLGVVSVTGPTQVASSGGGMLPPGTVELPPIIVRKDQAGTSLPVRGRLVEVNEPHRFVVVDKGTVDGVRVGMKFDIVRNSGTVIGQATVVRVRPQLSACDIVRSQTSDTPKVGDLAVQTRP